MRSWLAVLALVAGCKDREPVSALPSQPVTKVAAEAAAPMDAVTSAAMPHARHGFLVFVARTYGADGVPGRSPVQLIDPDSGAATALPVEPRFEVTVGPHVLAGQDVDTQAHWLFDLRSPTPAAVMRAEPVDAITPDDRLVWRCDGGAGEPFTICASDAIGSNRREVYREPAIDQPERVMAAGTDRVLAVSTAPTKPAFSIALADGKRTDYPALLRAGAASFVSPNATKVASCAADLLVTTLDGSQPPSSFPLGGDPTRCTCRFSSDDTLLACSIAPAGSTVEVLDLWTLATGARVRLAPNIATGDFAFAPDGSALAYISDEHDTWILRTTSADGKMTKELLRLPVGVSAIGAARGTLVDLYGWTAPNETTHQ